jgi:hypothetical protein
MERQVDTDTGRQIMPWEVLGQNLREFLRFAQPKQFPLYIQTFRKYYPILSGFPGPLVGPTQWGGLGAPIPDGWTFSRNQLMWMNAHKEGIFSFLQGTRNDYSRISEMYSSVLRKYVDADFVWRVPGNRDSFGPLNGVPFLDPYQKDGGYAGQLMALRRWVVDASSIKHVKIFGRRRWRQFLLKRKHGLTPLSDYDLHRLKSGDVIFPRPGWFPRRGTLGARYEEEVRFLHEIFPDT